MEQEDRVALIVGLGNPGERYLFTRHNAGFLVMDELARRHAVALREESFQSLWGTGFIGGKEVMLLKPMTFMNRSGEAVGGIAAHLGIGSKEILVVHDDLDLPGGRIRITCGGGTGGHRGVGSIAEHIGNGLFPRLKLGIGRPPAGEQIELFVLQEPHGEERDVFADTIQTAVEAVEMILSSSITSAMNLFNRRKVVSEPTGGEQQDQTAE
jgi:PTH1 family peptidyl-tRNA hydrolase